MSQLLTLLAPAGGAWNGDPETLSPTEHYNELTWTGTTPNEFWTDAKGLTRGWDLEAGSRTASTQNGLKTMVNTTGYWFTDGTPTLPFSSLTTTTDMTAFFVSKWGGNDNDTFQWTTGTGVGVFRQKASVAAGGWYIQIHDESAEDLIQSPAFAISSGQWDVWAVRFDNTTGAGVLDTFHFQNAKVNTTNASWTAMTFSGVAGGARLLVNNIATEPFNGTIAEIVVFDKLLTDEECQSINAFLTTKWGITAP